MKMFGGFIPQHVKDKYDSNYIMDSRFKILLWLNELKEAEYPFGKNSLSINTWKLLGQLKNAIIEYYKDN